MNGEPAVDGRPWRWLRVGLLFATFMGYSAMRVPVPGVNEPHYLTKARHYWQPQWCAGDLFLESANAHQFFYETIGWLVAVCPLEQAAWIGRGLALLLLAVGWDHFVHCLTQTRFGALWSAWLFLLLHTIGNFSGEWLVGGVEAKVFAWGLAFYGFGCLLRGRATGAAATLGLSVSMHPVVGGWSVIAATVATLISLRTGLDPALERIVRLLRSRRGLVSLALFVVCCLPGLIPAVQLLLASDADLARRADFIQFRHRLAHHLDPLAFSGFSYAYYAAMVGIWLAFVGARRRVKWTASLRWFQWLVTASVLVAVVGCVLALPRPVTPGDVRLTLLKFYPFRLADILVPMLVSVLTVRLAEWMLEERDGRPNRQAVAWAGFGIALLISVTLPGRDRIPGGMDPATHREWLDVCEWVRTETAPDSVVYAVHENWAVKWYAERPEYVNFKDCPQDAAGIVTWYERQRLLTDWSRTANADGIVDAGELEQLQQLTGIAYLVSRELPRFDTEPRYHNETFFVYALP